MTTRDKKSENFFLLPNLKLLDSFFSHFLLFLSISLSSWPGLVSGPWPIFLKKRCFLLTKRSALADQNTGLPQKFYSGFVRMRISRTCFHTWWTKANSCSLRPSGRTIHLPVGRRADTDWSTGRSPAISSSWASFSGGNTAATASERSTKGRITSISSTVSGQTVRLTVPPMTRSRSAFCASVMVWREIHRTCFSRMFFTATPSFPYLIGCSGTQFRAAPKFLAHVRSLCWSAPKNMRRAGVRARAHTKSKRIIC